MAARTYTMTVGDIKTNAVAADAVGTETIDATVAAGQVSVVIQGDPTVNTVMLRNSIRMLADFVMEVNK